MNERIRELAKEAEAYADYYAIIADELEKNIFIRRFAELIVKECVDVLNRRFMGDINREDLEVRRCIADIKKHFGVNDEPR